MSGEVASTLQRVLEGRPVPGIVSAYLFGSQQDGRAHRDSDVDVAVLLDREVYAAAEARFEARLALGGVLARALRSNRVDLVDLQDAPPTLARRIMTEGLRLVCSDEEADHAARRRALLLAADLEPFLRRTRRIKLDAIGR